MQDFMKNFAIDCQIGRKDAFGTEFANDEMSATASLNGDAALNDET
jgi:hypothetical protein